MVETTEGTPTSSQPSSPQQTSTPFLTPLTFQVHPSTLQALQINPVSPNFTSGVYPASLLQPAGFGSSFASMASVSQTTDPSLQNNPKKSKPAAKSKTKQKAQSSSTRKATTSKIPKAKSPPSGNKKKRTKITDADEVSDEKVERTSTRKAPVRWEDDKNEHGESAMSLLLKWITTYGNWARYKDGNIVKKKTVEGLIDYLADNGIARRKVNTVMDKISNLEQSFHLGSDWLNGTGKGVMLDLEAEKDEKGWDDNHPEYVARRKSRIEDYVRKYYCKYYYELEPALGTRDKSTRIASANSANQSHPDESLDCLGLTAKESTYSQINESLPGSPRNDADHSQASNDEYYKQLEDDNDSDISNEEFRRVLEDEFPFDNEASQPPPHSSRRKTSLQSQSLSTTSQKSYIGPSKNGKSRKLGAESQVTQVITKKDPEVQSSLSRLEDVIIENERDNVEMKHAIKDLASALKPKSDSTLLLSKDEQIRRVKMDSQLQACKLQAAKLELQKTKQAMKIQLADARGKFIAQMMNDKDWTFEKAKEVACEIYKTPEPIPDDSLDMSFA